MTAPPKKRRRQVCEGKRRYPDELTAKVFGMNSSSRNGVEDLYTYRCEVCGGWHLTKHRRGPAGINKSIHDFG